MAACRNSFNFPLSVQHLVQPCAKVLADLVLKSLADLVREPCAQALCATLAHEPCAQHWVCLMPAHSQANPHKSMLKLRFAVLHLQTHIVKLAHFAANVKKRNKKTWHVFQNIVRNALENYHIKTKTRFSKKTKLSKAFCIGASIAWLDVPMCFLPNYSGRRLDPLKMLEKSHCLYHVLSLLTGGGRPDSMRMCACMPGSFLCSLRRAAEQKSLLFVFVWNVCRSIVQYIKLSVRLWKLDNLFWFSALLYHMSLGLSGSKNDCMT